MESEQYLGPTIETASEASKDGKGDDSFVKQHRMSTILKQCLGIDVSKQSLSLSFGVLTADLDKQFTPHADVSNDAEGFEQIGRWLSEQADAKVGLLIVMEATGVYHQGIAHYLHGLGHEVSVMQSGRVKRYAQSLDQRSKTDALDSRMLSMLGLERDLRLWHPPSATLQQLKALSRERSNLLQSRSVETNRQESVSHGVHSSSTSIDRQHQRLELINSQISSIEREMRELIAGSEELQGKIEHLESIPGVSFITAATVVGETLGFDAMDNAKQLTSYAGYDVVQRESGNFRGRTRISKRGNAHIRAALHMPSMTCVRCNPTLKQFYQRLKPNKEKPIVALVAVQRKLLLLMYTLWKNEQDYDPEYENKKRQRLMALAAQDNGKVAQTIS